MDVINEEIEALKGIFCDKGELEVYKDRDGQNVLHFQLSAESSSERSEVAARTTISLTVTLPPSYPSTVPSLSLSSTDLTREQQEIMKEDLMAFSRTLPSEPMVMNIVCWVQEHAPRYINANCLATENSSKTTDHPHYAILHLDHMRAKHQYIKTLTSWARSGSICGRIIFYGHLILVILVGSSKDIKGFISKLKSQTVDVDSRGRSCKEKMMSVVSEGRLSGVHGQSGFFSSECSEISAVRTMFEEFALKDIFEEALHPLFHRNSKSLKQR